MQPPSRFLLPTLLSAFLLLSGCDSTDADAEDTGEERVYGTAQVEGGASYAWTTPQSAALEDVPGFSTRLLTFTLFRPFPAEGGRSSGSASTWRPSRRTLKAGSASVSRLSFR